MQEQFTIDEAEWLEASWTDYALHMRRGEQHDFKRFKAAAEKVAEEMRYALLDHFSTIFWQKVCDYSHAHKYNGRHGAGCDGGGAPLIIYERGFWKPILYDAVMHGMYEDWRTALVYLHLSDRYIKRGELLNALVCALYCPPLKFDRKALRAYFKRRSLLPKQFDDHDPQLTLF